MCLLSILLLCTLTCYARELVFDDNGKPAKDGFDHMMENSYRYTLTGAKYEDSVIYQIPPRNVGAGSWMGA